MNKRDDTRERRTHTTEKLKIIRKHYEQLYAQVGQSRRNEQISRNTLSAKIESKRNRPHEQVNH